MSSWDHPLDEQAPPQHPTPLFLTVSLANSSFSRAGTSESSRAWQKKSIARLPNHPCPPNHIRHTPASTVCDRWLTCHFALPQPPRNPHHPAKLTRRLLLAHWSLRFRFEPSMWNRKPLNNFAQPPRGQRPPARRPSLSGGEDA